MKRLYIFAFTLVVFTYLPVSATIINIPDDYPTIQQGIDASTDGDTVLVERGTYVENINFNGHNIALGSLFLTSGDTSYISSTIIDGSQSGSVVSFLNSEDNSAVITGFTIRNGLGTYGGGISCDNNSNPTISNNTISGNTADDQGGGIRCYNNSNPTISNNTISGNTADDHGGGIRCDNNSNPAISNNAISGNTAEDYGGGISCENNSSPTIANNTISGNTAYYGGGIHSRSGLTILSNSIHDNHALDGGGICVWGDDYVIDSNIVFRNSSAPSYGHYGGGIYVSGPGSIKNNIIYANSGTSGSGLHCSGLGIYIINNVIISNSTLDGRAAVDCYSFVNNGIVIKNCVLWNQAVRELDNYGNGSLDVSYSVIRNGYPGTGNLSAHPLMLDPLNNDFNVCSQSPCIDAGDPDIYDPDGTRSDIGIFFPDHPDCFIGSTWNVSMAGDDTTGNGSPENPFRTIQHAVDISLYGDSILVENGTYIENINIHFKRIAIISNYILSGQFEDIQSTILDGDSLSTVAYFTLCDSMTAIEGFTITNGGVSGIICRYADPIISNNIIRENYGPNWGGGIACSNSSPKIAGNIIVYNHPGSSGGGIYSFNSNPVIINNTISGNSPSGVEIAMDYSGIISNSIIWANTPLELHVHGIRTIDITYSDIRGGYEGEGNIDANPLFVDPVSGNYNICAQSPCVDAGDPDMQDPDGTRMDMGFFFADHPECDLGGDRWYVSTAGNDDSGDGSQDNPFRTIQHAINICFHSDTIIVENGVYEENIIVHDKSIVLASEFLFSEDWQDVLNTTIAGDSNQAVVTLESCDSASSITGFTISNGYSLYGGGIFCNASNTSITNNIITQNTSTFGGGICCFYSNSIISDNIISNNIATSGGSGVYCFGSPLQITNNHIYNNSGAVAGGGLSLALSDALITNNKIFDNSVSVYGAGLRCNESDALIINNTISGNTAGYYGGGLMTTYSSPYIVNTIFWGDSALIYPESNEIYVHVGNSPVINYSNIEGGWEGEGNIDADPLFRDPQDGDFHLMSTACGDPYDSPCIDAGDPSIEDIWLDCSWGLGTIISDMGAYGGGDSTMVGIDDDKEPEVPIKFGLSQNYPNPFNAMTVIRYSLPSESDVTINIFDILGRKVETLVQGEQQAGYHQAVWDAGNRSSGMYFYRIEAGEYTETRKMVLLR